MDLTLSPEEEAFRDELRAWVAEHHPGREPEGDEAAFQFRRDWQKQLYDAGWAGVSWPREYGGRGATLVEQAIFNEEMVRARAPQLANVLGLAMGGPTVIAHGTEEQRQRFLTPILSADEIWCQGFSEPDSGSDLASAVQVRPLRQITGEAEFNELFLEEARIPDENIVGGEGNGWNVAITTLMHERATLAFGLQVAAKIALAELFARARETPLDGGSAADDELIRQRLAQLYIESEVLRLNAYRGLTATMKYGVPGAEGSLGKWHWSELNQALTELALDVAGPRAQLWDDPWTYRFLRARANSIEGGTTEILKNIVAERVLGLPRLR
ncbi:MAG: acyl-CoA dehydrogenase [Actinobacteria bacterium]|nr:MAG: acyl-CoA dehydrogenase [Actinomycetota bacterium]